MVASSDEIIHTGHLNLVVDSSGLPAKNRRTAGREGWQVMLYYLENLPIFKTSHHEKLFRNLLR